MISVGSRDERKGLGSGFVSAGGGRTEMDESDLEEGEACSYPNHEYDEGSIDPDVALSYIDEKIQDVLGHCQKDFEGGVSAENLGAKFGGYGSFLPMHQRSPVWSHPRIPSKVHDQTMPNCSINSQLEAGQGDAVHSSTTHLSGLEPNSTSSLELPAIKAPSLNHVVSRENCLTTTHAEAITSKYESTGMRSTSKSDQKTLKVRIKMGTDNLATQKNAAIYSGLGLDMSPSSSDDSPSECEGISHGPKDAPFESPSSILQIMASLPKLLSPLPDDFIQLIGEGTDSKEGIPGDVLVEGSESSGVLLNESITVRSGRKLLGGKKIKSVEGCGFSLEFNGGINKNGVLSRKERSNDALNTDELVSETLKLPLLSSSFCDDSVKGVGELGGKLTEASESAMREKIFSDHAQKEQADPQTTEANGFVEKGQAGSGRKAVADKVYNPVDDLSDYTVKDKAPRGKTCDSVIFESKAWTALNYEHTELPENAFQMGEYDGMTLPVLREQPTTRGKKKKSKGVHGIMTSEGGKQTLRVSKLLPPKTKKSSGDDAASKNDNEGVRVQKDHGKSRDAYRDFFGEFEEEDDRLDSVETPSVDKLEDSEVSERRTSASISAATERSGANKVVKPLSSDVYPRTAINLVQCSTNGHGIYVDNGKEAPVTAAPVVFEDNWVLCDRCQKWRLLPAGTNPDHLPEKWLCSMLDWLPDMNRCSVSEDETTKALVALYQGPPPAGQSNLQNAFGSLVGGTLSNSQHSHQRCVNHSLHALPDGKKKFAKEMSIAETKDGSFPLSFSVKKGLHSSMKSRSLNDVNKSPAVNSLNAPVDKHKTKHKILEDNSDIGDTKNLKVKSKKDPDQDCSRSFKKSKTAGVFSTEEDWIPDHGRTARKVGQGLNGSNTTTSCGKDQSKLKDSFSSRDSKYGGKNSLQVSIGKKRNIREYQDIQTCSIGNHVQENRVSIQNELIASRKEKKARGSKSEGRESSTSKGSARTDKKMSQTKKQKFRQDTGSTPSQRKLDGRDSLKGDFGTVLATAAATSSSSKVSGSHKAKAGIQEVKGSPVESVSSSPVRLLNLDKLTNKGKDDSLYAGAMGSPRCSDDEDNGGSDRSETATKNKSLTLIHIRSHESTKLDPQDKDVNHMSDTKFKAQTLSPDIATSHYTNGDVDTVGQNVTFPDRVQIKDQCQSDERTDVFGANMSLPGKTGRGLCSKDHNEICKSESKGEKVKNINSLGQLQDQSPLSEGNQGDNKSKLQEKFGFKSDKSENMHTGKNDCTGNNDRRKENQLRGKEFQEGSVDAIKQEALPSHSQNQVLDFDAERSSRRSISERIDQEILGKEKSSLMPSSGGAQIETVARCPQPSAGFHKGSGDLVVDPSKVDDAAKLQKKQIRKADHQNGTQHFGSKHAMLNGLRSKELDAPSPTRRDSSSHAANNAVKEAKDLKHLADRLKNSGSTESTGLYFQAALKFLHGASLLESGNNDNNAKHNEMIQSKQMYSSTAKLCEFCAHEYEKLKDMAAASLAYKCMEVAYMRVVYSSHYGVSRDQRELQTALKIVPIGESPSSSASDVDNVNNSATTEKFALPKGVSSPQVAGTLVIPDRNSIMRLLDFAQDVNFAMEASRKSRLAFAAANSSLSEGKHADGISSIKKAQDVKFAMEASRKSRLAFATANSSLSEGKHADSISSIKKALDFNFQDVEGLLRLVRLAMEGISR